MRIVRAKRFVLFFIVLIIGSIIAGVFVIQNYLNLEQNKIIKVACVGDSITSGFGYPDELQRLLGAKYKVYNFGSGGASISSDSQTPYIQEPAFTYAMENQPDLIVIMLGTNDARFDLRQYNSTFKNDYSTLISRFQSLQSQPQIYIVKPPVIIENNLGLSAEYFRKEIIPKIEEVANESKLPLIDVYSTFKNSTYQLYDGIHPTSDGAKLIAHIIYLGIIKK